MTNLNPPMSSFESSLVQELQSLATLSLMEEEAVYAAVEKLVSWQAELQSRDSTLRLFWCFAPHLSAWLGPCTRHEPRSSFLKERLESIPIWRMEQEVAVLGSASSDTVVLSSETGVEILLRPLQYQASLEHQLLTQPQSFATLVSDLGGNASFLAWRQELNLAHEWGHIATDNRIEYQGPLLERLDAYPPESGYLVVSWVKELLEGLAEFHEGEGAVPFLLELAKDEPVVAQVLLRDRCVEYPMSGIEDLFPGLVSWLSNQLDREVADIAWDLLEAQVADMGEQLQSTLMTLVQEVPVDPDLDQVRAWIQQKKSDWSSHEPLWVA